MGAPLRAPFPFLQAFPQKVLAVSGFTWGQERVKSFFRFCYDAGLVPANPATQLSTIQVKLDEASNVRPFELKEYKAVLAAILRTPVHEEAEGEPALQPNFKVKTEVR